jgi:hypothetical protein
MEDESRVLSAGTREIHDILGQRSLFAGRDMNSEPEQAEKYDATYFDVLGRYLSPLNYSMPADKIWYCTGMSNLSTFNVDWYYFCATLCYAKRDTKFISFSNIIIYELTPYNVVVRHRYFGG